ncbi:DUF1876 domain-containing protein [Streptosporangium sp. NPDC051022]|uniref:DUF1876 domain-containing protein n=1 Tax=Streptosporangium sp. NPDC051022 TaxID=3155752 RepID=UPI00343F3ED6
MEAKQWNIQVDITEEGDDTFARVFLNVKDIHHLTGFGHSRRNPIDRPVPEIGDELAVARALADLADKLLATTSQDIAQFAGPAGQNRW